MIKIDALWMSTEPGDMRSGMDTLMNRVIQTFGHAQAHHAYLFANRSANRIKMIMHDGFGIWMCSRRLHKGKFDWAKIDQGQTLTITSEQFQALIVGLPWQRLNFYQTLSTQ